MSRRSDGDGGGGAISPPLLTQTLALVQEGEGKRGGGRGVSASTTTRGVAYQAGCEGVEYNLTDAARDRDTYNQEIGRYVH